MLFEIAGPKKSFSPAINGIIHFDNRIAISGEIPNRPFNKADSVFLETPSPLAASVTVNPNGSMHSSLITHRSLCVGMSTLF